MGLFASLFGKGKETNIAKILKDVDNNGGQKLVQIPFDTFSKYLRDNGEVRPSQSGSLEGFLKIDGKRRKVGFQYGILLGLKEGETLVTVFKSSGLEDQIDTLDPQSLAAGLSSVMKKFITNKSDAISITFQIISLSSTEYFNGQIAKGEAKIPSEDQYPPEVRSFLNKVTDENEMIKEEYENSSSDLNYFEINKIFGSLTGDIADLDKQLLINFAIAKNIIQEWDLNN